MLQEMMMRIAFAALAAATVMAPARSAEPVNPLAATSVVLGIKDLDLASVDGQRRLAIRIDNAARAVCGDRVATIHLALAEQSRACQSDVTADIRSRIEMRTAGTARAASGTLIALR